MVALHGPKQEGSISCNRTPMHHFLTSSFPSSQIHKQPRSFCQENPKVWVGNRLAFRGLALLWAALYAEVFGFLETPRRSKMAWLEEWLYLLSLTVGLTGIREVSAASCAWGRVHQKEFRCLTCNMKPDAIVRRCMRDHPHIKIQGQLTKGTAVYCLGLARALGALFQAHLKLEEKARLAVDFDEKGLEEPLVDEVVRCEQWQAGSSWKWHGHIHINILELASYLQAFKKAARLGGGRFSVLLDSSVALYSSSKGRSSSRALAPLLRKTMAIAIAFGVSASNQFCSTRLTHCFMMDLHSMGFSSSPSSPDSDDGLRTGSFLSLDFPPLMVSALSHSCPWAFLHSWPLSNLSWRCRQASCPISFHQVLQDFDGPVRFWIWVVVLASGSARDGNWILAGSVPSRGIEPRHADDLKRGPPCKQFC